LRKAFDDADLEQDENDGLGKLLKMLN